MYFTTSIEEEGGVLVGPARSPRQMLAVQDDGGHASIHDDATAQAIGFKGGTIEGPTHFSQFVPLAFAIWGERWLSHGCLSVHYRAPVFEGEQVRAYLRRPQGDAVITEIWMMRDDGTEILRGTASVGPDFPASALDRRLTGLPPLADPVILADVKIGQRTPRRRVRMDFDQHMGALYPFTLAEKLARITEPSLLYDGSAHAFGKPVVPMEMISVLMQYTAREDGYRARGPVVGLFADQEIRLIDGPIHVGEDYDIEREIVFLSGSRRTESVWISSTLYRAGTMQPIARMLLNIASIKETYAPYATEHAELYG
ncbi:hypothetical protein [Niveispirillum sp.]|uniref:hypothetical protein n=1 Tax=Niveispirillum sp. TaxID=1917217 RepID=UPI001B40B0EF|nr:hypothetical protein [Niveispirillum sp.]MBP7335701.1 hypothetical protein [Niveispirillum sp.]